MQVRVNVPDRLAAEAQARGVSLEMYVEEMLAQQIIGPEGETLHESVSDASTESASCGSRTGSAV